MSEIPEAGGWRHEDLGVQHSLSCVSPAKATKDPVSSPTQNKQKQKHTQLPREHSHYTINK